MEGETNISQPGVAFQRVEGIDVGIAALAERQHGVVSLRQLVGLGLSAAAVRKRVATGRLHRVHRGVYAVGHRLLTAKGHRMAAVLLGGTEAALSHRAAGAEWNMRAWSGRPEVTLPRWRRSTSDVTFHCSALPADEQTVLHGIPITTVPRTILDLARVLPPYQLLNAINEAEQQGLGDVLPLRSLLERHRGERGTGVIREVLDGIGYGVTKGELEDAFALFIVEQGLPMPERNAWVQVRDVGFSPDCFWRDRRLIVELHSILFHSTMPKVTRDARRDRLLLLHGYHVIHVTWAQLHDRREADALARDLWTVLGR